MRLLTPVLVALIFVAGCSGGESDARPTIVASSYPLAWAAERVAGSAYRVVNLTPAGAEPHGSAPAGVSGAVAPTANIAPGGEWSAGPGR